jgi:hypothetical protein
MRASLNLQPLQNSVHPRPRGSRRIAGGFSLVEVILAIGIAAFAVLTVLGLLGTAMRSNADSEERIQAANLATTLLIQYREFLNGNQTGAQWASPLKNATIQTGPPSNFGNAEAISIDGVEVPKADPNAAYALSYAIWKDPDLAADNAPYDLITCSLRFQWPPKAVFAGNSSNTDRFDSYEVTTSFLVNKP